ncbi:helix-turn-helix domain-containing protein, partial [Acidiphilium multivorum]
LVELGLVVMRDSPNGKRYGRRDRSGRIVEAYGFDLSPLGVRLEEFRAVAEKGRAEREAVRQLRRRVTIARKAIEQIVETAVEVGLEPVAFVREAEEARRLCWRLGKEERSDVLAFGVTRLEDRHGELRQRLESLIADRRGMAQKDVETDPKGPENRPHQ